MLLLPVTVMELGVLKSSVPTVFVTKFSLRLLKVVITTFAWSCPTGHRCRCSWVLQDFSLHTLLCGQNRTYTLRQLNAVFLFISFVLLYPSPKRFSLSCEWDKSKNIT